MRGLWSSISAAAVLAALCASAAPAAAATMLNVNWSSDCGKSTCFNNDGVYSQTFSAKNFSGPVSIGQLLMQRGVLGGMDGSTFRISFQLNGEEVGTWGHYNMAGIGGDELNFWGENFVWNPEMGDLVLVLALDPAPKAGGGGGGVLRTLGEEVGEDEEDTPPEDDVDEPPPPIEVEEPEYEGPHEEEPPQQIGAAVPEPATWAMMITGFGMAGATLRRRRPTTSA